jgi:hypothetical protein
MIADAGIRVDDKNGYPSLLGELVFAGVIIFTYS